MKALRYLLIVMGLMSVLSISAQALAQEPQAQMQSTSVMPSAGSTLPSAAATGAVITGSTPGSYTPASISNGPRRAKKEGDWEDDEWGDTGDPYPTPLGDAAWLLILAAAVYGVYKRKRV